MYAVISDVHGNLAALEAVLEDIGRRGAREVLFLGDAVGYGPEPNECVALIEERCTLRVAGNHDWAVLGLTNADLFNPLALAAIRWTEEALGMEARERMNAWPLVASLPEPDALLVHSGPEAPEEWPYVISRADASRALRFFKHRLCLLGHSHLPFIAEAGRTGEAEFLGGRAVFRTGMRYVINTGSVGQPRDGDPRACYLLLDGRSVELVRVEYPAEATQRKMRRAGLPEPLAARLSLGR